MRDRIPVNPGRVLITPENGSAAYYATMTRADNPTQEGTPLNKASLLKDATAALFGLGTDAVPDDALNAIKTLINGANANADTKAKVATGSYTGTGKYGSDNKNKLTFDFVPKFVIIQGSKYYSNIKADCLHIGILTQGCTGAFTSEIYAYRSKLDTSDNELFGVTVSWSDNTVTWYAGANYQAQLNESGYTYGWIAIG